MIMVQFLTLLIVFVLMMFIFVRVVPTVKDPLMQLVIIIGTSAVGIAIVFIVSH